MYKTNVSPRVTICASCQKVTTKGTAHEDTKGVYHLCPQCEAWVEHGEVNT